MLATVAPASRDFRAAAVLAAATVALIAGCGASPRQSGYLTQSHFEISSSELRARTYATGRVLALRIEAIADSVLDVTTDPEVRRNALRWKSAAIPSLQEATLIPDPLIAAMDLYAYMVQTHAYFGSGDGARLFGAEQAIVTARLPELSGASRTFAQRVVGERDVGIAVADIERWAKAHPVRGPSFQRESLIGDWADAFAKRGTSALATLGHADESLSEIAERLQFINETMLKQVRWNVEQVASDVFRPEDLGAMRSLVTSATVLTHEMPELVRAERAALVAAMQSELAASLDDVDRQRGATIAALRAELAASLRDVDRQREATIAALRAERIAALAALDGMVQQTLLRSTEMIDHAFWRLAELTAALLLGGALVVLAARWRRFVGPSSRSRAALSPRE